MVAHESGADLEPSREVIDQHASLISDLINNGSIELCDGGKDIPALPDLLPFQKSIFTPATKKRPLPVLIRTVQKLYDAGFDPVPHIAARRITSRHEVKTFLKEAVEECGVHRVLVIGGDVEKPVGPYDSAGAFLSSGVLEECGVKEVVFAGYPDGHPSIAPDIIESALLEKLSMARKMNIGASVITQFSFLPRRIIDYCSRMARLAPDDPIYVGIPGPCDPIKLFKYAKICGVSASVKMLGDSGFKALQLVTSSNPDEQLSIIAKGVASHHLDNVVGVHIFSFGNIASSAKWLSDCLHKHELP